MKTEYTWQVPIGDKSRHKKKPKPEDKCRNRQCTSKVALKGAEYCVGCGKAYANTLKGVLNE